MSFFVKWRWEILSPLAGLLLTLAFAPYNYSYLALVSLVFVFLSWLDCSPLRSAIRGYLYGLGLFGLGISWVYISIHDYGGAPAIGAFLLTILVICFWSLFPALTAFLSVKIAGEKLKKSLIWIIPFVWVLIEYFRGYWFLNGFPWLQLAYSQLETPLQGFVPIIGVYGTSFLLAITATIIVASYREPIKVISRKVLGWALISILLVWGMGAYLQSIKWTKPIGGAIKVSLIQGNVAQDQKWLPENKIKTLLSYQQMTEQNWDSDVIVWPESAIPALYSQVKESFLDPLSAKAKSHNTDVIVGMPARNEKNEYFNTVFTLGKHPGRYNKNHLLPFGEYLPLQPVSGFVLGLVNISLGNFVSGGVDQKLLHAGGYPFATSICYEDAFSEEAIRNMPEAAYLVNVTNDAWFGNSIEPFQHMQLAQMRALEVGRYMLRTTNTGVTAIVAPDGSIVSQSSVFKKTVLTGEILPMGGTTPYAKLGDGVIILMLIFCLITMLIKCSLKNEKVE